MKVLKTIIIAFLLLQTAVSFGQTKEETELWINQKVQKYSGKWIDRYVGDGALYYHFSTTDFQLKDGMLVVKTGFKYTSNYSDEGLQLLQNKTTTYKIPVNKIVNVYYSEAENNSPQSVSITFEPAKYNNYQIYRDSYSKAIGGGSDRFENGVKVEESYLELYILDEEENIYDRIVKALKHYQTFFPKPEKKKETF